MKLILPLLALVASQDTATNTTVGEWFSAVQKPGIGRSTGGPRFSPSTLIYCGEKIAGAALSDDLKQQCLERDSLIDLFPTLEYWMLKDPHSCAFVKSEKDTVCAICEDQVKCRKDGSLESKNRYQSRPNVGRTGGQIVIKRIRFSMKLLNPEMRKACIYRRRRRWTLRSRKCSCCTREVEACCARNGSRCKANACYKKPEPVSGQYVNQGLILIEEMIISLKKLPEDFHHPSNWKELDMSGSYLKDAEQHLAALVQMAPNLEKMKVKACGLAFTFDPETFKNQKHLKELDVSENGIMCVKGTVDHLLDAENPVLRYFNGDWNPMSNACTVTGIRRRKGLGSEWSFNRWLSHTRNRYGGAWADDLKKCMDTEPGCSGIIDVFDPDEQEAIREYTK